MSKCCPICESRLRGRTDQKFCSDFCRNQFHNAQRRADNAILRRVNSTLRKNRSILKSYLENNLDRVPLNELLIRGFKHDFFTSRYQHQNGQEAFACYDVGFEIIDQEGKMIRLFHHPS